MSTRRTGRSLVAITFAIGAVLAGGACANDQPAGAAPAPAAPATPAAPAAPAAHVMVSPADLKWGDAPSLPPGAKVSLIEGVLDQPVPFTLRIQLPAGYQIPAHHHPATEHTTVLSGTVNMGMGDTLDKSATTAMPTGSLVIMPADTNHYLWTAEAATVQVHGVGPFGITYVDPADDPRKH